MRLRVFARRNIRVVKESKPPLAPRLRSDLMPVDQIALTDNTDELPCAIQDRHTTDMLLKH